MMLHDLPPWHAVYQQTRRWARAGGFESMVEDLRALLRLTKECNLAPSAVILDSRTIQSTPENGGRAGFDGAKKRKGSKVYVAEDTLRHLLALKVTAANQQEREQVEELARSVQLANGSQVELAYVDQGYTGDRAARGSKQHGIQLEAVKLPKNKSGKKQFVMLPKRWVVERSFAWAARLRRLARDYERLSTTLASYHWHAFALLMLNNFVAKSE